MKSRNEWPLLDLCALEAEITIRKVLLGQMVGTLYPGVLADEIHDLSEIIHKFRQRYPKHSPNR